MFRNNPVGSILVSVFFLLALLACGLAAHYFFSVRKLQEMEFHYQANQAKRQAMQLLAAETVEYSKRNPDIDPLLQQYKLKSFATSAPVQLPSARPR